MVVDPFEYVIILTSLILGLGITQILINVADMLSNLNRVTVSYAHTLLIIVVFNLHIQEWWVSYHTAKMIEEWTITLVLFVLAYPIALFTLARLIFPTGLRESETNLEKYYEDQWTWFFFIFLFVPIISFFQNITIGGYPVEEQIPQMALTTVILIFLIFRIRNKWAHVGFMALQCLIWIIWLASEDQTL